MVKQVIIIFNLNSNKMSQKTKDVVEDDYSAKLDMCLTDGIIKTGKRINYKSRIYDV